MLAFSLQLLFFKTLFTKKIRGSLHYESELTGQVQNDQVQQHCELKGVDSIKLIGEQRDLEVSFYSSGSLSEIPGLATVASFENWLEIRIFLPHSVPTDTRNSGAGTHTL